MTNSIIDTNGTETCALNAEGVGGISSGGLRIATRERMPWPMNSGLSLPNP